MKKPFLSLFFTLILTNCIGQNLAQRLEESYKRFESDTQLQSAVSSLYVADAGTGQLVFDKNGRTGLAPASTQKVFTAAAAYELLGKDFTYATRLGINGSLRNGVLEGDLWIIGEGDPTLGSWRWKFTKDSVLLAQWKKALKDHQVRSVTGSLIADGSRFETQSVPDGWIWQDIGNYYGAGCLALNWKENQYEIRLKSGNRIGDTVLVVRNDWEGAERYPVRNELRSGAKGSGDNAYVYLPPYSTQAFLRGTIPVGENNFSISGSLPDPTRALLYDFTRHVLNTDPQAFVGSPEDGGSTVPYPDSPGIQIIHTHYSPRLDSIIYWFLKKSINLYGEALLKTMAYQKTGLGATGRGVDLMKGFWKEKGIAPVELNMADGSGLSPLNRVTTHAQVAALLYARKQAWFPGYYDAFPEYNGMKMKSGTINGVKGFCGYHRSHDGHTYVFSFLVNNYNGATSSLVQKMYRVLDELK